MASPFPASNVTDSVLEPLNRAARIEIWERLFGDPSNPLGLDSSIEVENLGKPYLENLYVTEQSRLTVGFTEESRKAAKLAIKTHEELCDVVRVLEENRSRPKTQSITDLKTRLNTLDDDLINDTIDLALRIAFLVNARHRDAVGPNTSSPTMKWRADESLEAFLQRAFPPATWQPKGRERLTKLHISFTAAFMVEVCHLKLESTDSLHEHLDLDRSGDRAVLKIFPYKACLNAMWTMKSEPRLPRPVVEEAIKTLNLLFPHWDMATGPLLQSQQPKIRFDLEEPYNGPRALDVFGYDIWRDRLLAVHDQVYVAPPASWKQLRRDKRNPAQYWTFWIALAILVLTIVTTLATVVQTVYAILAYCKDS